MLKLRKNTVRRRLFMVGCPRSGTTLIQSALAAHSAIQSFPETHFFATGSQRRHRRGFASKDRKEAKALMEIVRILGTPRLQKMIPKHQPLYRPYCRAFRRILDRHALENGKNVWLEKTPRHLHCIPAIERAVPNAMFIHVVRNGADVVASLYEVTHKHPEEWEGARSVEDCINRWNRDLLLTIQHHDRPTHRVVRYETFVDRPDQVLKRLCEFVDIPFERSMINERTSRLPKLVSEEEDWKADVGGPIRPPAKKFDRIFDSDEQQMILSRLGKIPEDLERLTLLRPP